MRGTSFYAAAFVHLVKDYLCQNLTRRPNQELPAVQNASQGDEDALSFSTPARPAHPPQAILVQGSVHRQDREAHRFPAQGLRLDQLHAPAAPTRRRPRGHADVPTRRSPNADTPVPLRPVRGDEPFRQPEQWTLYVVFCFPFHIDRRWRSCSFIT